MTAVVTGSAQGIGAEIARRLIEAGEPVIGIDRLDQDTVPGLTPIRADLMDPDQTEAAARALAGAGVTRIVHNAGAILAGLLDRADPGDIARSAALHLTAPMILTQAVLPDMRAAGFGRILFVTSRAAMGLQTRSAYAATKAGAHGLMRTWAMELAPDGITANAVAPGPILTENFWGQVEKGSALETRIAEGLPVRRLGTVEDVAGAAMFFMGADAGFVTGQTLFVCGGASLGGLAL